MIGGGALAIWFDVDAAGRDDVDAWYPHQHLSERLSVPGFLRGRRYAAVSGGPVFFTLYETRDASVLLSPAYLERLNHPTEWTRRALSSFRGMTRNAYQRLSGTPSDAAASHLMTVRIKPDSGRGPYVRQWLEGEAPGTLGGLSGVIAWGTYVSEIRGTSVITEEAKIVGDVRTATPFLALCEVGDSGIERTVNEFWRTWGQALAAEVTMNLYRLMYGLTWISATP